jgi:aspartyl-tRNA(Asn)/glutamyl-tRNA(Gln) amidotransferase subunit A
VNKGEIEMTDEIAFLTAGELVAGYRAGSLSPVDSVAAALQRIDRLEPHVNAFQHLDAEGARRAAAQSAARWRRGAPLGALDGVPVTVKDMLLTRGWPTLKGSRAIDPA